MGSAVDASVVSAWRAAARDEGVAAEIDAIHAYVAAMVESRGPACWASGRCCNFDAAGHRLFTTGLETACVLSRLGSTPGAPASGLLTRASIEIATARGGCPFQAGNVCGVHAVRPAACRVYFCDRSAEAWQHELGERVVRRIREVHDRRGVPYLYAEWRALLALFSA